MTRCFGLLVKILSEKFSVLQASTIQTSGILPVMRPHTSLRINKLLLNLLDSVAHILISIPDLSDPRLFIRSTSWPKRTAGTQPAYSAACIRRVTSSWRW